MQGRGVSSPRASGNASLVYGQHGMTCITAVPSDSSTLEIMGEKRRITVLPDNLQELCKS